MREILKQAARLFFLVLLLPAALLAGFGRFDLIYTFFAHSCALVPGIVGDYVRSAYYRMTLRRCPMSARISFGAFFAHPTAVVGPSVYIGAYSIIGHARIGARTQIASHVQVVSGRHQHPRDEQGRILDAGQGVFQEIALGADCWIGSSAVVMANVGDGTTVGAGSVVTKDVPPGVVAAGNPARVLKPALAMSPPQSCPTSSSGSAKS